MNNISKLDSKTFELLPLDWDTDYFGVKSAKVVLKKKISKVEQDRILNYCHKFHFITISNLDNNNENNVWIGKRTKAFLTDLNIQFIKHININTQSSTIDKFTNVYNSFPKNKDVLRIAQKAFLYSRFFNDPYLPKEKAQSIYLHWTDCAFNKPEKYFVITERNDKIAGYLLFFINFEKRYATIELIAVDEIFRSQSIGKSLIAKLEFFAFKKGIKSIKVGTQVDNVTAVRFYNACGFQYAGCSSIYHYWPGR
ncbi:MAG: GNAT family N-acetyltransferase [Firmicutes bacterium]|nr:GNAT family N-acetyltransferase [Bacillota bacterium]